MAGPLGLAAYRSSSKGREVSPAAAAATAAGSAAAAAGSSCSRRMLHAVCATRLFCFFGEVRLCVGLRFMVLMLSVFVGLKGMLWAVSLEALLPYVRELQHDGVVYQRTLAVAVVPWGLKGLIGTLSDTMPLFGFHKRWYMLLGNCIGVSSVCALLLTPAAAARSSVAALAVPFFGIHLQIAIIDLLCEGVYSEIIRVHPESAPKLVAFVNLCVSFGGLLGRTVVGPISDAYGAAPLFCCCLPLALQSLFPVLWNFAGEQPLRCTDSSRTCCWGPSASRKQQQQQQQQQQQPQGVFVVALLTSACACGVALLSLLDLTAYTVPYAAAVLLLLSAACVLLLPRGLSLCAVYFFLDRLLHLNIQGAVNFFYTAGPSCVLQGPHFDYTYFSTYTALAGTAASWTGIWLFQKLFKRWSCRSVFWLANLIRLVDSVFDYIMVRRLNVLVGIPDKLMYLLGDAIAFSLIMSLSHMAGVIAVSKLCPPKLEATVYAIVSGLSSLGWNLSKLLGARAIELSGILTVETAEGGCNFEALPSLILWAHFVLPALSIPLAYFMLPAEPLTSEPQPAAAAAAAANSSSSSSSSSRGEAALGDWEMKRLFRKGLKPVPLAAAGDAEDADGDSSTEAAECQPPAAAAVAAEETLQHPGCLFSPSGDDLSAALRDNTTAQTRTQSGDEDQPDSDTSAPDDPTAS